MATRKQKFTVFKANIKDDDGVVRRHDEVVELSAKLARHYNKLGFLRPYMEPDSNDNDATDDEEETPVDDEDDLPVLRASTRPVRPTVNTQSAPPSPTRTVAKPSGPDN